MGCKPAKKNQQLPTFDFRSNCSDIVFLDVAKGTVGGDLCCDSAEHYMTEYSVTVIR